MRFRHFLTAAVLASSLFGQAILVVETNGRQTLQLGPGSQVSGMLEVFAGKVRPTGRVRCWVRCNGKPLTAIGQWQTGDVAFLSEVYVGVPNGYEIEWAKERGATDLGWSHQGYRVWRVLGQEHRKPYSPRIPASFEDLGANPPIVGQWPLDGGRSIWWDLVPIGAADTQVPSLKHPAVEGIKRFLGWSPKTTFDEFPELRFFKSLFVLDSTSFDPKFPIPNFGHRSIWWAESFTGNADGSTRVPNIRHPTDWGTDLWDDGGQNGDHYDGVLAALEEWLIDGNPAAFRLAEFWLLHKVPQGFIDAPGSPASYHWRDEKGQTFASGAATPRGVPAPKGGARGLVGDGVPARFSHQWSAGLYAIAALTGDVDLMRVANANVAALATVSPTVTHYGPRSWVWTMQNRRAAYQILGRKDVFPKAQAELDRFVREKPSKWPYWPDDPVSGEWAPWQNMMADAEAEEWRALGLKVSDVIATAAEYAILNKTYLLYDDYYLQVTMRADIPPWQGTPQPDVLQGPSLTATALPSLWYRAQRDPAKFKARYYAAVRSVTEPIFFGGFRAPGTPYASPLERSARCTGWGSAGDKIARDLSLWTRPKYLKLN